MEFLKALERAISFGVTTQEFLPIWNLEVKAKQQDNSRDTCSNHRESVSGMESDVKESELYLKLRSDLQQFVLDEAHSLVSKMSECLEQKRSQRLAQLMFDLGDSTVMSHNRDTVNSPTSSVKLFPEQKATTFEQQVIENVKLKDSELIMETSEGECCDFPQESAETFSCVEEQAAEVQESSCDLQQEKQEASCNVDTQQSQAELNSCLKQMSDAADCLDTKSSKLYSSDTESLGDAQTASSQFRTTHTINVESLIDHSNLLLSQYKCSACKKVKGGSDLLENAGVTIYTDATESDSSTADVADDLKSESETPPPTISYMPISYAAFNILGSDAFAASHDTFLTPFYYMKSNSCKVRLGVYFDEKFCLNVYLLISAGSIDDKKWPCYISCYGFINNKGSLRFSPIWSIESFKCQKPKPNQEFKLKANVNLRTLRQKHKPVTYEVLQTKLYSKDNIMTFNWEINISQTKYET